MTERSEADRERTAIWWIQHLQKTIWPQLLINRNNIDFLLATIGKHALTDDEKIAMRQYFKKNKTSPNIFKFWDVIFDFTNWVIVIWWTEKSIHSCWDFHKSSNITYKKKALCLIFAALSLAMEWRNEISLNEEDFLQRFSHAFIYLFSPNSKTEPTLPDDHNRKNSVPIAIQIIEKHSNDWEISRKQEIIKVERTQ